MRALLRHLFLIFGLGVLPGWAGSAFVPDTQYTNLLNTYRFELQARRPVIATNEIEQLATTMARSNRLAQIIPEMLFSQEPDFPAVVELLKEFPARIDTLTRFGTPLLQAAISHDQPDTLAFLLAQKLDPSTHVPQDQPLLLQVMNRSRWDMAVMLIKAGASVTATNNEGMNAGGMLVSNWYPGNSKPVPGELVPLLLTNGIDVFARIRNGSDSSIIEQCLDREEGYRSGPRTLSASFFSELLLTNNASPARRTPLGGTALHLAVQFRYTNAIEFLLQSGFSINHTNNAGLTPLQERVGAGQAGGPISSAAAPGSGFIISGSGIIVPIPGTAVAVPPAAASSATTTPPPAPLTIADYLLARGAKLDFFSSAGLGHTNDVATMLATNAALAKARDSYGRTALHYALLNHAWSAGAPMSSTPVPPVVTMLLGSGADSSATTTSAVPAQRNVPALVSGTTPLHLAARLGDTPVLRALLAARAKVQLADANGDTALHLAARTRQTNAITLLLSARAPIEVTNRQSHTPLRAAVESSATDAIALLLDAGANRTNGLGSDTLLHIAAARNDVNSTTLLLKRKFAIESRDGSGNTPLQIALFARSWNTAKLLRDEGANLNATNYAGDTALHLLATQQSDMVNHVPEEPFYIQWERKQIGNNRWLGRGLAWLMKNKLVPQLPAQKWTNSSLSAWLIEHGAKVNLTNRAGQNPLGVMCSSEWARWPPSSQSSNRFVALLNAGVRLDQLDTNGMTPLHIAATRNSPAFLSLLLARAGTNLINQPDGRGRTPLHAAVTVPTENFDCINLLLAAGANVNAADHEGSTPLHVLMGTGQDNAWMHTRQRELAVLLLTNKANPDLRDKQGRTPLAIAISRPSVNEPWGSRQALLALLSNGVDPNIADTSGNTAAHLYFQVGVTNPGRKFSITDGLPTTLLEKTDLTRTNRAGLTALHQMAMADYGSLHLLHIADRSVSPTNTAWMVRDPDGNTPLHLWAGRMQPCNQCAEHFGNLLVLGNQFDLANAAGETPLTLILNSPNARWFGRTLSTRLKAEQLTRRDRNGDPLLHRLLAAIDWHSGNYHNWLTNASLANLTNAVGDTPLHIVLRSGDFHGALLLMQASADPTLRNARGETPLQLVCIHMPNGLFEVRPEGTRTPFFVALQRPDPAEAFRWLDADPGLACITNKNGQTPLMIATERGSTALVERLRQLEAAAAAAKPGK